MKINNKEFVYGLGQISAIVVFMAALVGYWIFQDHLANWSFIHAKYKWFIGFAVLYIGAQMVASIIDILQGRHKATLNNFLTMWLSYLMLTFVDLLFLVLSIPLIIISFILGPVMFFGGFFISNNFVYIYSARYIQLSFGRKSAIKSVCFDFIDCLNRLFLSISLLF